MHELRSECPTRLRSIKQYEMSPALAYLWGVMRGDGCAYVSNSWFLRLEAKDEDFVREFHKSINIVEPNCSPCTYLTKRGYWQCAVGNKSLYHAYINFDASTMLNATDKEKIMFIKGFYDSEGSVYAVAPRAIYCTNTNPDMLILIQKLLTSLGIYSSLHELYKSKPVTRWRKPHYQKQYHLMIHGRWNIIPFCDKIGFTIKRKQERLMSLCDNYANNLMRQYTMEDYCEYLTFDSLEFTIGQIVFLTKLNKGALDHWRYANGVPCIISSKAQVKHGLVL